MALRLALASLCFERAWNLMKLGMAMAARMPMIATTIISSISVNPFTTRFIDSSFLGRGEESSGAPYCNGWAGMHSAGVRAKGADPGLEAGCQEVSIARHKSSPRHRGPGGDQPQPTRQRSESQ